MQRLQSVDKPLCFLKMGCRVLLALLVLHRAKLLASNQSILALGRSPRTGRQPFVPLHRATALSGCRYASLHSGFVRLTASLLAWSRGGSPSNIAPARMPGVYAQRLYARTHTSGRTKSVQDAPTINDHDCTDAKPTKHTQPFTRGRG